VRIVEDRRDGPIRVVVADDHPLYRSALCEAIESSPDLGLVDQAADGHEAWAAILRHSPDVAVLDMRMPGMDGKEIARRSREQGLGTRILFVSAHQGGDLVLQAFTAGGAGYLSKSATGGEICSAVNRVARGEEVLPSEVGDGLAHALRESGPSGVRLSARELGILKLIAQGDTAPKIASHLHIAVPTVKTHIQNLYGKLGVGDRGAAVAEGMRRGLLD
jgi:two-component system nitrate/nitrite response regulator NarL